MRIIARVPNNVFCCLSPFIVGAETAWSVYRLGYGLEIRTVMAWFATEEWNLSLLWRVRPGLESTRLLFKFVPWRKSPYWTSGSSLSRLHDHTQLNTPHSFGLLWMNNQSDAKTLPENTQHSQETDIHVPGGIFFLNKRSLLSHWLLLRFSYIFCKVKQFIQHNVLTALEWLQCTFLSWSTLLNY
jgi:hypothetical protein